jgi:thiamine-phosphate pyrophosphorylase
MSESYTAGAHRALERAQARAKARAAERIEPADLLAALVDEPESRAVQLLREHGLEPERVFEVLDAQPVSPQDQWAHGPAIPHSPEYHSVLGDAALHARRVDRNRPVGTEHLLAGLVGATGPISQWLTAAGLAHKSLIGRLDESDAVETAPIPMADDIPPLVLSDPTEAVDLGRIFDASANRASEGLRVVEDYVRFALDDPMLTRRLKEVRHRLGLALRGLDSEVLLSSRDTPGDVGTHIMTATESARENPRAVLIANFKRTTEALRSLEEFGKLIDVWLGGRFEILRYDMYTLEKLVLTAVTARRTLGAARLCVLVGGVPTLGDLTWVVGEALAGGADVIQLREKNVTDRELLHRAREVRILTAQAKAHFILNDRPDLARLAGADGVHLGQDDVKARDARRILGPRGLLGISTHDREQLENAVLDGAGYLGVGPVFPSTTKEFAEVVGLGFVRLASESTTLPWFAIGGITEENVESVLQAGATRIAVSAAVVRAERPREAAKRLKATLDATAYEEGASRP